MSYLIRHGGHNYRGHYISATDDFGKVLRVIAGRKGHLKKLLREYEEWRYIHLDAERIVKGITIRKLPARDRRVLEKYVWKPVDL
ncbi:MAG: hypothetical protein U0793_20075 [Gemmataceae bacterium]